MTLEANARLMKSPNSATLYLAIPADMVKDSQFPFRRDGDAVFLEVKPEDETIIISGLKARAKMLRDRLDVKQEK
jgi:hypothetical protein